MATCKECFHFEACSGFKPTDLDKDVFHYLKMGCPEEIPDIDKRCDAFKQRTEWVEVVRCKDCKYRIFDEVIKEYFCNSLHSGFVYAKANDYCSYGERKDNG